MRCQCMQTPDVPGLMLRHSTQEPRFATFSELTDSTTLSKVCYCGGKQVCDPWRHHRPRQERHHWTETRERQTTNEDRSGSITVLLQLVSDFTSPTTPSIGYSGMKGKG
ncbi:hypothetical protein CAPTEDRAFT_209436 [Capitella teleta]|uniref:Uncharacterized protein n=1 Tax=Capitella teleta TaxID=283909 RepID=R7UU33_CAPTE|nr:hypothetical protein CAPTEDRAFT_209436 [Capitella teleta]|eukprot:ELU07437.1 hypothetical protein CAPTEDRAFT_209436 [Capitella teleta]